MRAFVCVSRSTERTARRRRRWRRRPRAIGDLAALGRDGELDDLVRDVGLEAFGMALLQSHHVGDDTLVLAVGELIDDRAAGLGIVAPTVRTGILARGIP